MCEVRKPLAVKIREKYRKSKGIDVLCKELEQEFMSIASLFDQIMWILKPAESYLEEDWDSDDNVEKRKDDLDKLYKEIELRFEQIRNTTYAVIKKLKAGTSYEPKNINELNERVVEIVGLVNGMFKREEWLEKEGMTGYYRQVQLMYDKFRISVNTVLNETKQFKGIDSVDKPKMFNIP